MKQPIVSIVIVTYNSVRYIPEVFGSIEKLTNFEDVEVIVVDNGSKDETVSMLKEKEYIRLFENKENTGFTGGNNIGFEAATGEYVLCYNHDVMVEPDAIVRMIDFMKDHEEAGAVSGVLYKWDHKNSTKTEQIDSVGFKGFKNRKIIDSDSIDFAGKDFVEVFGVSAAFVLYRQEALEKVYEISGFHFDPEYFMYKEDVDMAYRMRHAGYKAYIMDFPVGYHDRWETGAHSSRKEMLASRKGKGNINMWSYRNHLMTLYKNEPFVNLMVHGIFIDLYEAQKFIFALLFEQSTLKGLFDFLASLPLTLRKRRAILSKTTVSAAQLREWFN